MLRNEREIRDWVRKNREFLKKSNVETPEMPHEWLKIILLNLDVGLIPFPIFDINKLKAIPANWIKTIGDYPKLLEFKSIPYWVLWPMNISKKTDFLGKELKKKSLNIQFPRVSEWGQELMTDIVSVRELIIIYNILNMCVGKKIFLYIPSSEWTRDNLFPGQKLCRTILHADQLDNEAMTFRLCPYNQASIYSKDDPIPSYRPTIYNKKI